jgi:DNA-binding NarL/FixJ family response regulator
VIEAADPMMNVEEQTIPEKASSRVRILVADDHEVMRLGIRNLLESRRDWAICAEASDGREAVEKSRQYNPDLIILDITMPTMNGLEAARHISRAQPDIPIILFSLHLADDVLNNINSLGIRGAVSKGEAGRDLVEAVDTVLRGGTFFRRTRPHGNVRH